MTNLFLMIFGRILPTTSLAACTILALSAAELRPPRNPPTEAERNQGFRNDSLIALPSREARLTGELTTRPWGRKAKMVSLGATNGPVVIEITDGTPLMTVIEELRKAGSFRYVEPNYLVTLDEAPNDPCFAKQYSLREPDCCSLEISVHAERAWATIRSAPDVIVAIIDSGIRANHEDLRDNLWDTVGNTAKLHNDVVGHGTKVAGIIGAKGNNGVGVAGIAWDIRLMPLKAFAGTTGMTSDNKKIQGSMDDILMWLDFAVRNGAKIINASYGQGVFCQAEFDMLKKARDAGVIVVASAANDNMMNHDLFPHYPGSYPLDNIVTVANADRFGNVDTGHGSGRVDLAAPGDDILSSSHDGEATYQTALRGSSFAVPHATGALALLIQRFPRDSYRDGINRLLMSVQKQNPALEGKNATGGILNIGEAIADRTPRPFNDDFANRQTLVGRHVVARSSNVGATIEPNEADHVPVAMTHTVWWKWQAPADGAFVLSTEGSEGAPVVAAYCGPSLTTLGRNVALRDGLERNTWLIQAKKDVRYQIAAGSGRSRPGMIVLTIGQRPDGDDIDGAVRLRGDSRRAISWDANNRLATAEPAEPGSSMPVVGKTVWASWIATHQGRYELRVSSGEFAGMLGVLTRNEKGAWQERAIAKFDGKQTSAVCFEAVAGMTYYFRVDSQNQGTGRFHVTGEFK